MRLFIDEVSFAKAKGNWNDSGECNGTFKLKKVS